jgi:hypothetical protein
MNIKGNLCVSLSIIPSLALHVNNVKQFELGSRKGKNMKKEAKRRRKK